MKMNIANYNMELSIATYNIHGWVDSHHLSNLDKARQLRVHIFSFISDELFRFLSNFH